MVQVGTAAPATPKVHKYILFDTSTFVAHITLNHPPYNVLTVPLMVEVAEAVESLNGRNDIKCIVLDSSQKAFCAGISLEDSNPYVRDIRQRLQDFRVGGGSPRSPHLGAPTPTPPKREPL